MPRTSEFDALYQEILQDDDARLAARENAIRRSLASEFEQGRSSAGMSVRDLAKHMNTSNSQVQRVLHREVGGSLTLRTIVRAADALDLALCIHARAKSLGAGQVVDFGKNVWHEASVTAEERTVRSPEQGFGSAVISAPKCGSEWIELSYEQDVASSVPEHADGRPRA